MGIGDLEEETGVPASGLVDDLEYATSARAASMVVSVVVGCASL